MTFQTKETPLFRRLIKSGVLCLGLLVGPIACGESPQPFADSYVQQIKIRFVDTESAKQANVKPLPLFDGHHRAVSCRWDDNWTSDNLGARTEMEAFGIRGTWYLNGRTFSPENKPADYLPVAQKLLSGGNSIGGHSETHPFITYFHSNRTFAEMSNVRIAWEAALDRPVISYAYSFVDLAPPPEGNVVLDRTLRTLSRAGYYHIAEFVGFFDKVDLPHELSPIMPPENQPFEQFEQAVQWAYDDPEVGDHSPMISNSMHAWYGTQRLHYDYSELRKRLKFLADLKDVWHCNQNQYAAYRRQYRKTSIEQVSRNKKQIVVQIRRPRLLDLNDTTPLTFEVIGVDASDIESIDVSDATVTRSSNDDRTRVMFHLGHPNDETLPEKIAHIANPSNQRDRQGSSEDNDFPSLRGRLAIDGNTLKIRMSWDEDEPVRINRIRWRVPIAYRVVTETQRADQTVPQSLIAQVQLRPTDASDLSWGNEHFAAEIDFESEGQCGRVHLTCQRSGESPDESLPQNGFAILGPVPAQANSEEELIRLAQQNFAAERWEIPDSQSLSWRTNARDGYINQEWMNPEYVRTTGTWDAESPTYALRTVVTSPDDRQADLVVSHPSITTVVINGEVIEPSHNHSARVTLKSGENTIAIVYPGCRLNVGTQRLSACFFRLADPATGERFRDIKYAAN
ncbi:hypothetical protein U8335_15630 [Roseiconus lacunae]|uniref:hypothetical protein n=1 Tax=Roseiconus lacunae TaxID=2605694 RepID=UPI00308E548E|nr:hypothetical protein U8335_15630 [Stieleria sp. HD01]